MEQNLSQTDQDYKDSFDDFEGNHAEAVFNAFFGDCSEEELLILRELGAKFNIRANDALWAIAGVFVFFGRVCNKLPQKIKDAVHEGQGEAVDTIQQVTASIAQLEATKAQFVLSESLMKISQDILNQNRKKCGSTTSLFLWFLLVLLSSASVSFLLSAARLSRVRAGGILPLRLSSMLQQDGFFPSLLFLLGDLLCFVALLNRGRINI